MRLLRPPICAIGISGCDAGAMGQSLYRGMDRDELDRQYNARATVGDIEPFLRQYAELSARARNALAVRCDLQYGQHRDETLDFFPAGSNAPLFIFIHGGYWRLLSKDDSSFFAENFVRHGISVAAINYSLAPAASLERIVAQVRSSFAWLWNNTGELNVDRRRFFVAGSSAGAHLAAMILCGDWNKGYGLPDKHTAGAVLASGLFELEPLRYCHPNEWLNLDEDAALQNSPVKHLPKTGCPILVTWGGSETDEFKRQSREFASAWTDAGFASVSFEISDRNHFDIILDLCDPNRELTRRTFEMINPGR